MVSQNSVSREQAGQSTFLSVPRPWIKRSVCCMKVTTTGTFLMCVMCMGGATVIRSVSYGLLCLNSDLFFLIRTVHTSVSYH